MNNQQRQIVFPPMTNQQQQGPGSGVYQFFTAPSPSYTIVNQFFQPGYYSVDLNLGGRGDNRMQSPSATQRVGTVTRITPATMSGSSGTGTTVDVGTQPSPFRTPSQGGVNEGKRECGGTDVLEEGARVGGTAGTGTPSSAYFAFVDPPTNSQYGN